MSDFLTMKEAKSVVHEFLNKVKRLNDEFNDPRLAEGLVKGFTIKEALLLVPSLQFANKVAANPDAFSEEECETMVESLCASATLTLNFFKMAGVDIEKPASEYLTDSRNSKILPILDDIKDNLEKLKKVFESNDSEVEDFWD